MTNVTLGPPILAKCPPLRRHLWPFTLSEKQTSHEWRQFTTKYRGGNRGTVYKNVIITDKNYGFVLTAFLSFTRLRTNLHIKRQENFPIGLSVWLMM